jgi:hypothetical protein
VEEKQTKIMNREGIAIADEDIWPQVTDKPLSLVIKATYNNFSN